MSKPRFGDFREIQDRLRTRVRIEPLPDPPRLIAAVDVHLGKDSDGIGAAVLVDEDGWEIERSIVSGSVDVPYVPGYLSFREMPLCRAAIESLSRRPDVILVDGQGIAHPRRFGLACHLGVEVDIPAIGVAKSLLTGKVEEPGLERGSTSEIKQGDEVIGMAVRTRSGIRPLFVSPGHRITLPESVRLVLELAIRYRLPEPSRLAHRLARDAARAAREDRHLR